MAELHHSSPRASEMTGSGFGQKSRNSYGASMGKCKPLLQGIDIAITFFHSTRGYHDEIREQ